MSITVMEALAEATSQKRTKVTFEQFGEALGVSRQYVNQIKDKPLNEKQIKQLEKNLQINLTNVNQSNDIEIDFYPEVFGSCGTGTFVPAEYKEKILIPKKLLGSYSPSKQYSVINAYGDSMLPYIQDKDKLIVEHWNGEQIKDNHIYVFRYGEKIFCKRLVDNLNHFVVKADNLIYEPIKVEPKDIQIIGEIIGLIRFMG